MQQCSSLDLFVVAVTLMRSLHGLHLFDSSVGQICWGALCKNGIRSRCNLWTTNWICHSLHVCVFVHDTGERKWNPDLFYWLIMALSISWWLTWNYLILFPITHLVFFHNKLLCQSSKLYEFATAIHHHWIRRLDSYEYKGRDTDWWGGWQEGLLPVQTVWMRCDVLMWNMAWGTPLPLRTAPIISNSVQSSPAMASISCFLSCGRARYMYEAVTWLPTVTQLENRGWRRASCWVLASRFSGQEALLKNKAGLSFGATVLQGACSVRVWSCWRNKNRSSLTLSF